MDQKTLNKYLGARYFITTEGLYLPVRVVAVRTEYGNLRVTITDPAGHAANVSADRIADCIPTGKFAS